MTDVEWLETISVLAGALWVLALISTTRELLRANGHLVFVWLVILMCSFDSIGAALAVKAAFQAPMTTNVSLEVFGLRICLAASAIAVIIGGVIWRRRAQSH